MFDILNSPFIILVDSEFRALIRSFLENLAKRTFFVNHGKNETQKQIINVSLRVASSLLAVYLLQNFQTIRDFKPKFTMIFLVIFVIYSIYHFFELKKNKNVIKAKTVIKQTIRDVKDNYKYLN